MVVFVRAGDRCRPVTDFWRIFDEASEEVRGQLDAAEMGDLDLLTGAAAKLDAAGTRTEERSRGHPQSGGP